MDATLDRLALAAEVEIPAEETLLTLHQHIDDFEARLIQGIEHMGKHPLHTSEVTDFVERILEESLLGVEQADPVDVIGLQLLKEGDHCHSARIVMSCFTHEPVARRTIQK